MPLKKGRGQLLRTRTIKLPGGKYKRVDIYAKAGPRGGHAVAGPTHTKKGKRK